jgi:hypothetical protein
MFETYQSLPKTVKAVQFTDGNKDQVFNSLTGQYAAGHEGGKPVLKVTTIHGEIAIVRIGDWIVQDAEPGTYYPVKDAVFRAAYNAGSERRPDKGVRSTDLLCGNEE